MYADQPGSPRGGPGQKVLTISPDLGATDTIMLNAGPSEVRIRDLLFEISFRAYQMYASEVLGVYQMECRKPF